MSTDAARRCSSCGMARDQPGDRWAAGRTPLTEGLWLCPTCHSALPPVHALHWQRGPAPRSL